MRGAILLVRHGESEGNAARTFSPSTQVPLTERGRRQAAATAEILRGRFAPVRLVTSSFRRAHQTADGLAG